MNTSLEHCSEHVRKRNTAFGRWMPAILYAVNIAGALATAVVVGAGDLLLLVVFPLPAFFLYVWRTRKEHS